MILLDSLFFPSKAFLEVKRLRAQFLITMDKLTVVCFLLKAYRIDLLSEIGITVFY